MEIWSVQFFRQMIVKSYKEYVYDIYYLTGKFRDWLAGISNMSKVHTAIHW